MGLGGLTRDSIVGLNNLVKDEEEVGPRATRRLSGSWNNGSEKKDEFLYLLDEPPPVDDAQPEREKSFETSLNDGLASMTITPPRAQTPTTPAYSKVSATNSRSLDSYRTADDKSDASSTAQSGYYQGFQYEGYTDYYADSYNYDYPENGGGSDGNDNILCCLFPWLKKNKSEKTNSEDDAVEETENETLTTSSSNGVAADTVASDTSAPTPLSANDLRTTSPHEQSQSTSDTTTTTSTISRPQVVPQGSLYDKPTSHQHDVPSHSVPSATSSVGPCCPDSNAAGDPVAQKENKASPPVKKGKKGILKTRASVVTTQSTSPSIQTAGSCSPSKQRHLFPTYSPSVENKEKKSISFIPMARVLTIASRKDLSLSQKCQVWWQKHDYDEFKKTGRIISKAMECGGSEIWLASSNAWGKSQSRQNSASNDRTMSSGQRDSEEYNKALSKYVGEEKKDDDRSDDFGSKWWCKFGHSRRGLEHVASSSEGKARQQSVLRSIRMTLEEQRRQRASRTKDPNKLRNVSMQYTSWARDLALAAGTADAEAVSSNFDAAAKSRAHHFAKQLHVTSSTLHTLNQLDVGGGVAMAVTSQVLDANTHDGRHARSTSIGGRSLKDDNVDHEGSGSSLSKRAKGFIPGSNGDISAAAVLSGMGNVQSVRA